MNSYPHMCRDGHEEIGHHDSEHEECPLCRALAERDAALEKMPAPEEKGSGWKWYGFAGHLSVSEWCRFHLCTEIGEFVISTVGKYVPPHNGGGPEGDEATWLKKHPNGATIGCDRTYETMVFRATGHCTAKECNCGLPLHEGGELASEGYNNPGDAAKGHMLMCAKVARGDIEEAARGEALAPEEKGGGPKCPECEKAGRPSRVKVVSSTSTLMARVTIIKDGIRTFHDPNETVTEYECACGHKWAVRTRDGKEATS